MSGSTIAPQKAIDVKLHGYDGTQLRSVKVDSSGNIAMNTTIDLTADMEVTGSSISFGTARPVASGDITLVTVGATERLKLHKAWFNSKADFSTNPVILMVGSNEKGSLVSVKDGGQYILASADVDFNVNALGDDLIITIPVGMENNCSVNFTYEIM